jgi:hypothetical protein
MGVASIDRADLTLSFILARSFDTKIITAGGGVAHVDVVDVPLGEEKPKLGLDDSVTDVLLRYEVATGTVRIECQVVRKDVDREAPVFGIPLARVLVNVHGPRERKILLPVKGIIREPDPALHSDGESPEALAARPITRRDFDVSGMSVPGRFHRPAHGIGDRVADCNYAICLHLFLTR